MEEIWTIVRLFESDRLRIVYIVFGRYRSIKKLKILSKRLFQKFISRYSDQPEIFEGCEKWSEVLKKKIVRSDGTTS